VCRYTALNRTVWEQVESLVYYFLFPVLLFHSIVRSPLDLGAASSLIGAGLRWAWRHCAGLQPAHLPWLGRHIDRRADHAASAQVAFRFNSFIGLALAERLAGAQGLLLIAVLIGVCVPLFNVGAVWPMARHAQRGFAARAGAQPADHRHRQRAWLANLLGFHMPPWLEPTVSRIGAASLALGLMAAGAGHAVRHAAGPGQGAGVAVLSHQATLLLPLAGLGWRGCSGWTRADHRAADVLGPADGLQLLRAGRPHGLQRCLCGGPGHAVHAAGHGQPAVRAGVRPCPCPCRCPLHCASACGSSPCTCRTSRSRQARRRGRAAGGSCNADRAKAGGPGSPARSRPVSRPLPLPLRLRPPLLLQRPGRYPAATARPVAPCWARSWTAWSPRPALAARLPTWNASRRSGARCRSRW
jgi:malonate transporter